MKKTIIFLSAIYLSCLSLFFCTWTEAQNAKISTVKFYSHLKGATRFNGKQCTAEYALRGESYKQWVIVLPRPKGDIFYTWFYTSPVKQYNEFLGIAQLMLNSWTIIE